MKKVMTVKASELRTFAESLTSALEQVADKIGAIEDIISGEQEVEDAVADDDSDEEDEEESEVVESEEVDDDEDDIADDSDEEEEEVVEEDEDEADDADDEIKDFSARYENIKNSLSL